MACGISPPASPPAPSPLPASPPGLQQGTDGVAFSPDAVTHTLTGTITDPSSKGVNAVAFSPDGHTVAAADGNGHVYLWHLTG